jgi:hypothetical protein
VWGTTQSVEVDRSREVDRVVLVRAGSSTHQTNRDQRLAQLMFTRDSLDLLYVTMPARATIAPPGHYLLFVVDALVVPSKGRWMQIG